MSKTICEPIKLTLDSLTGIYHLIDASINNYDVYVKQVKVKDKKYHIELNRYEIKLYERNKDE